MSTTQTVTVTDDSFTKVVLDSTKPVLVDFWAQWCGPCKKIAPVLDEIASEHTDKLTVAKLDVDANPDSTNNFRIMSIPTMVLFHEGKVVKQIVGTKDKAALLEDLAEVLS
ncbi:thioredoxin [Rhodococcus koreensis]|uniref:thioredoxin n=1 Tax=Rhodococcus koreensis TaxID=99653 RepID=UPI00366F63DD